MPSTTENRTPGTLWVVGTPLGNPGDLSPRARQCLEAADLVLAEDTKREGLACARWGVSVRKLVSYNDHSEEKKAESILSLLREGKNIALISDAGMPVMADPGYIVIRACRREGLPVSVIPGPCAPVTALAGSGIPPQPFVFFGFLPRKQSDRENTLSPYASLQVTLVFFERKDRLRETLENAYTLLGPREVCLARELTKTHEEYMRFRLEDLPPLADVLGEVTVVIGPPEEAARSSRDQVLALIAEEQPLGGAPRAVARRVQARAKGWTTGEIYAILPRMQDSRHS